MSLASLNRRSENVVVHPAIVAELDLGKRHKGQSLGTKPDRQASLILSAPSDPFVLFASLRRSDCRVGK
jgi:hypothetical protein